MCTLTIYNGNDTFILTMNRDERRDRTEGKPHADSNTLYPIDNHAGGTWCGINTSGLGFALLNSYHHSYMPLEHMRLSRGLLIPSLLSSPNILAAESSLNYMDLSHYEPFRLWIVSLRQTLCVEWSGLTFHRQVIPVQPWTIDTSSSIDQDTVAEKRKNLFQTWSKNQQAVPGKIPSFHTDRGELSASDAVMMSRQLSHTKSITQLVNANSTVQMHYQHPLNNIHAFSASRASG